MITNVAIKGTIDSRIKFRRVSHRLGWAYSNKKQVIAVAEGSWKITWNFRQKNFKSISTAANSRIEPTDHKNPSIQAIEKGRAPGICRFLKL